MNSKRLIGRIVFYAFAAAYLVVIFYPLILMVMTSLKPNRQILAEPFALPTELYLDNFVNMITRSNYAAYFMNSIIVVLVTIGVVVILTAMASYVLAKYRFKGVGGLYLYFIAGLIIPIRLGTISILKMMIGMNLNDNLMSVIIVSIAMGIPFGVFILTDFIRMIPEELSNAARIDGASEVGIFGRIITPLLTPAIAAVGIVNFIPVWNDFWFPLVLLKSDAVKTVPLATALLFGQYQTNFGSVFAVLTLASLPVVIFYLIFSKWFVQGIAAGGVKG